MEECADPTSALEIKHNASMESQKMHEDHSSMENNLNSNKMTEDCFNSSSDMLKTVITGSSNSSCGSDENSLKENENSCNFLCIDSDVPENKVSGTCLYDDDNNVNMSLQAVGITGLKDNSPLYTSAFESEGNINKQFDVNAIDKLSHSPSDTLCTSTGKQCNVKTNSINKVQCIDLEDITKLNKKNSDYDPNNNDGGKNIPNEKFNSFSNSVTYSSLPRHEAHFDKVNFQQEIDISGENENSTRLINKDLSTPSNEHENQNLVGSVQFNLGCSQGINGDLGSLTSVQSIQSTNCVTHCERTVSLVPYRVNDSSSDSDQDDRTESDSNMSSDSSTSSTTNSSTNSCSVSSSDDDTFKTCGRIAIPNPNGKHQMVSKVGEKNLCQVTKTKGELSLDDLPPIEELHITVPEQDMVLVGSISAVVDKLVVILSIRGTAALDLDSFLFKQDGSPIGQVFDVLGPVLQPSYAVRFNTVDEIENKGLIIGISVYCAPQREDLTSFVFVEQLRIIKGSDASWKNNNEPPPQYLEYSDDEEERKAKAKQKCPKAIGSLCSGDSTPECKTRSRQKDFQTRLIRSTSFQQPGTVDFGDVGVSREGLFPQNISDLETSQPKRLKAFSSNTVRHSLRKPWFNKCYSPQKNEHRPIPQNNRNPCLSFPYPRAHFSSPAQTGMLAQLHSPSPTPPFICQTLPPPPSTPPFMCHTPPPTPSFMCHTPPPPTPFIYRSRVPPSSADFDSRTTSMSFHPFMARPSFPLPVRFPPPPPPAFSPCTAIALPQHNWIHNGSNSSYPRCPSNQF